MFENGQASRRSVFKGGLALLTSGAAGLAAHQAQAQDKIEQALVQYQNVPKDGAKCNICVNWVDPNACKIVAGTINPEGWCVAYAPKES